MFSTRLISTLQIGKLPLMDVEVIGSKVKAVVESYLFMVTKYNSDSSGKGKVTHLVSKVRDFCDIVNLNLKVRLKYI